jgi:Caspase domain
MDKTAALCIGINYRGSPYQLNGCVNDAVNTANYLRAFGFANIDIVTDDPAVTCNASTAASGANIANKLKDLVERSRQGKLDLVWISYSGHGTQALDTRSRTTVDLNPAMNLDVNPNIDTTYGDEADGLDDAIVPSDHDTYGIIRDDYLRNILASFSPATWVVVVMDACHSGTMGDLKYLWNLPSNVKGQATYQAQSKLECLPRVLMVSGCRDSQTSADAYFSDRRQYGGALTRCLLDVLVSKPTACSNVFLLLSELRNQVRLRGFTQTVQLSSSFDISSFLSNRALFPTFTQRALTGTAVITPSSRLAALPTWLRVVARACKSARALLPISIGPGFAPTTTWCDDAESPPLAVAVIGVPPDDAMPQVLLI